MTWPCFWSHGLLAWNGQNRKIEWGGEGEQTGLLWGCGRDGGD